MTIESPRLALVERLKRMFVKQRDGTSSELTPVLVRGDHVQAPLQIEVDTLLNLYQKGDYHSAKALAISMTRRFPDDQFSWKVLGAVLKQIGELSESAIANQTAVSLDANDAEAHSNLGVTLQELGRLEEALTSFKKAISLDPNHATAHYNLGITLKELGRPGDAETSYRNAIAVTPGHAEAHNNLGSVLQELGRLQDAEKSYRRAIALTPELPQAHNNLGNTLQEIGRLQDSEKSYREAIARRPDYPEAHNNLGSVLQQLGQLQHAETHYRKAIALDPHLAQAHYNLGNTLFEINNPIAALEAAIQSIKISPSAEAKVLFVESAKKVNPKSWDLSLSKMLNTALLEPWGRPSDLAPFACRLLKTNSKFSETLVQIKSAPSRDYQIKILSNLLSTALFDYSLLLCSILCSSHVADSDMEQFCTALRNYLLLAETTETRYKSHNSINRSLYCSLAHQCFINEYVFFQTLPEIKSSEELRDQLINSLESGHTISAELVIAVACYFPLYSVKGTEKLLQQNWEEDIKNILVQQIQEPLDEWNSYSQIPRLTSVENQISLKVQNQYEENPYPRWVSLPRKVTQKFLHSFVASQFPSVPFKSLADVKSPEILIAGCGTGQHPIWTAKSVKNSRILAIDLSMASLAYAKRKTIENGIHSIEYAQADLLKLASLNRTFDVIESSGVLHHLEDPFSGLQVLLTLLRSHGLMRLGFYSEIARRDIVRVRNLISKTNTGSSAPDIRKFRKQLLELKTSEDFGFATTSTDFFSTSTCRDLLFHVQEHRINLTTLAMFFKENDLTFLGFEIDRSIIQAYKHRFPQDSLAINLENWQMYEEENPNTFIGMYQFWIQKNGSRSS